MTGDARKLIAGVVARHQLNEWGQHDGWWECCCSHEGATPWTADHVAAEINKALGGLKPEYIARHESGGGTIHGTLVNAEIAMHSYVVRDPGVEDPGSGMLVGIETRWVSGWQAQP